MAKVDNQVKKCKTAILEGTVLVIDPSVGSRSSLPGYAMFEKGKMVDSGVIELNHTWPLHRRLQKIHTTLIEDFEEVNVLVIEDIQFTNPHQLRAQSSLFKAIGVFLACTKYEQLVEIAPPTWKAFLRRNEELFPDYNKGDEWDAIIMGMCILEKAKECK